MDDLFVYAALFLTCLVAGTVLPFPPGSSEVAMAGLLAANVGAPETVIATAVGGNVIGATTNYLIGRNIADLADRRFFPLSKEGVGKASSWFQRFGVCALAMCWLPTFGDAITVVAGLLRSDFRVFLVLVVAGKLFGHLVVASGVTWFL